MQEYVALSPESNGSVPVFPYNDTVTSGAQGPPQPTGHNHEVASGGAGSESGTPGSTGPGPEAEAPV